MDPRIWKRLSSEERQKEVQRLRAQRQAEERWRSLRNLTDNEIKELSAYEFGRAPNVLRQQLRHHRLLLKVERPDLARAMWNKLSSVDYRNPTEVVVVQCCHILSRYLSEVSLRFNGKTYTKNSQECEPATIQIRVFAAQ